MPKVAIDQAHETMEKLSKADFWLTLGFGKFVTETNQHHKDIGLSIGEMFDENDITTFVNTEKGKLFFSFAHPTIGLAHVTDLAIALAWAGRVDKIMKTLAFVYDWKPTEPIVDMVEYVHFLNKPQNRFVGTHTTLNSLLLYRQLENQKGNDFTYSELPANIAEKLDYLGVNSSIPSENAYYLKWVQDQNDQKKRNSLLLFMFHIYALQRKKNDEAVVYGRDNGEPFVRCKSLTSPTFRVLNTTIHKTAREAGNSLCFYFYLFIFILFNGMQHLTLWPN
jgi:hypothetical protein